jgi:hypothetical protein
MDPERQVIVIYKLLSIVIVSIESSVKSALENTIFPEVKV